jgi:hypothetical protein
VTGYDAYGYWDYHWYRQNPDGTWSHKPGDSRVTNLDNSAKTIYNPITADRNGIPMGGVDYSNLVGFYAIKQK